MRCDEGKRDSTINSQLIMEMGIFLSKALPKSPIVGETQGSILAPLVSKHEIFVKNDEKITRKYCLIPNANKEERKMGNCNNNFH